MPLLFDMKEAPRHRAPEAGGGRGNPVLFTEGSPQYCSRVQLQHAQPLTPADYKQSLRQRTSALRRDIRAAESDTGTLALAERLNEHLIFR
jgi:hypothetical protein